MLAVAVELDIHVIAVEKRVFVACLDAAADAEVLGRDKTLNPFLSHIDSVSSVEPSFTTT